MMWRKMKRIRLQPLPWRWGSEGGGLKGGGHGRETSNARFVMEKEEAETYEI
jgi:hypothetical protein